MEHANQNKNRIIRLPEVMSLTGLKRSMIYRKLKDSDFPPSVSLGERAVGWLLSDIEKWLMDRVGASKGHSSGSVQQSKQGYAAPRGSAGGSEDSLSNTVLIEPISVSKREAR